VTNELLRVNDELNNLFLRYERHLKKHKPINKSNEGFLAQQQQKVTQPQPQQEPPPAQPNEATLIDFTDDSTISVTNRLANIHMSGINATSGKAVETNAGDLDFDIFAQSRSATTAESGGINDLNNIKPDFSTAVAKDKPNQEIKVCINL
jgi:hypothetical protein